MKTETTLGSSGVIVKLLNHNSVSGLCSGLVWSGLATRDELFWTLGRIIWGSIFMPFVNFAAQFCIQSSISKACKFSRIISVLTQNYN